MKTAPIWKPEAGGGYAYRLTLGDEQNLSGRDFAITLRVLPAGDDWPVQIGKHFRKAAGTAAEACGEAFEWALSIYCEAVRTLSAWYARRGTLTACARCRLNPATHQRKTRPAGGKSRSKLELVCANCTG